MTPLEQIKKIVLTKNNKLNNRVCIKTWWENRNIVHLYNYIIENTKFIEHDCLFSERIYILWNNLSNIPTCYCGKKTNFINFNDGYREYCSIECSHKGQNRISKIKQNTDYKKTAEKVRKTNLTRYGVEHWFQTKDAVNKIKESKLKKYGDSNYCNLSKAKETNLARYGVEYTVQNANTIVKIQESKSKKYPQLRDRLWLLHENKTKSIQQIANELNCTYRTVYLWFDIHKIEPNFFTPAYKKQQLEVEQFIKSLNIEYKANDRRIISPKEIDIYIPSFNLGIEYNGEYWHGGDKYRHLEKHNICSTKNIKLLQFWSHEWTNNKNIVKSIISGYLNKNTSIYARNCSFVELNDNQYKAFTIQNHIQGYVPSSIKYGLIHNGELVAILGLGKSRFNKKYSHELLRFCNKAHLNVVGGFSKLLKNTLNRHSEIQSIQTFCDNRLFSGKAYEKFGFEYSHTTNPGYFYYGHNTIKNRQQFQKHKLKDIFDNFDPDITERENCLNNGWFQVWDCGQKCYTYTHS